MLFVTDVGERVSVKCGCGHFMLSLRNRGAVAPGAVRCLICDAQAPLADLVEAWRAQRVRRPDPDARQSGYAVAEQA